MNTITKFASALSLLALLAAPASALAYYPYTYFTGPNYFMGGGGFSVGADYYGSSNCNDYYGCGTIGYNAMTGQWTNGGLMGGSNYGYSSYPSYGGYGGYTGQVGGCNSCGVSQYGNNSYMQYIPASARQYMGGYGSGNGYGYGNGYIY